MDLEGKVALVTGGAVRVGRALSLALAGAGCHLLLHYGRSEAAARQTRAEAEALGVEVEPRSADLGDADATRALVPAAIERFGRLDVLINSAAIFPAHDSVEAAAPELWERLFGINLRGPFLLSQSFAAALPEARQGRIVNVLDARVRRPGTDHAVYRLTKSALWTLTENLALALAPRITVNAVALGAILPPPGEDETYLDELARTRVPLGCPGSPAIVAANVLHLLRSGFLTGVVLPVDGGEFL